METGSARVVNIAGGHHGLLQRTPAGPPASPADIRVDGWQVQPTLNRLCRPEATVRLRPQLMDLLVCLASQPGRVFSKDELVAKVWEGRAVSASAVSRCIAELRSSLEDDSHRPRVIETIPKRGYRLIAPVEPVRPASPTPPALVAASPGPTSADGDVASPSLWQRLARLLSRKRARE